MNNDSGVIDKVPLSCIATLLFSDAIAQPASTGCSSRVWVLPTSILQRKISRCIYVCIACYNCVGSQDASKTWKAFCKSNRPFSSSTWSGRLFFCTRTALTVLPRWRWISKFSWEKFALGKSALIHSISHQTGPITSGFECKKRN